jgi:hypothetical protein
MLVGFERRARVFGESEHRRVFARTVVVKLGRTFSGPQHLFGRPLVKRQMRSASQIFLAEPCFFEHRGGELRVHFLARMRGAGERDLFFTESERVGRAAQKARNKLHRFGRRTKKRHGFRVADLEKRFAASVQNNQMPAMNRFDHIAAHNLG